MGTMWARLCSHSDACVAGAGDNTKAPDVGKATVGQGACCYKVVVVVAQSIGQPAEPKWSICERGRSAETKKDERGTGNSCIQAFKVRSLEMDNQQ